MTERGSEDRYKDKDRQRKEGERRSRERDRMSGGMVNIKMSQRKGLGQVKELSRSST